MMKDKVKYYENLSFSVIYHNPCSYHIHVCQILINCFQFLHIHTLCLKKNDIDVAYYNFNAHQPILVMFRRNVPERVCYQLVVCYPTSPN